MSSRGRSSPRDRPPPKYYESSGDEETEGEVESVDDEEEDTMSSVVEEEAPRRRSPRQAAASPYRRSLRALSRACYADQGDLASELDEEVGDEEAKELPLPSVAVAAGAVTIEIAVGTRVYKKFPGHGWFWGTVRALSRLAEKEDDQAGSLYYRVEYEDGDAEDLKLEELIPWVQPSEEVVASESVRKRASDKPAARRTKKLRILDDDSPDESVAVEPAARAAKQLARNSYKSRVVKKKTQIKFDSSDDEVAKSAAKPRGRVAKRVKSAPESEDESVAGMSTDNAEDEDEEDDTSTNRKVASKRKNGTENRSKMANAGATAAAPKKKATVATARGAQAKKSAAKKPAKQASTSDGYDVRRILKAPHTDGADLPILVEPQSMFDDMIRRNLTNDGQSAHVLMPLLERLGGRPLRVATMCSGTESPLLALDMVQKSIRDVCRDHLADELIKSGMDIDNVLQIEHVFSCEIEPFKQAYIERNFHPPILFRDIRELKNDQAYTAYGSLVDVPGEGRVDLLIAGTSCVDYSNLNNKKKALEDDGESGQTFGGMIKWIRKARPPIVVIENVSGAPWEAKMALFEKEGYSATFKRLDTKKYYIPHTRQRGYLFAVRKHSKVEENPRTDLWQKTIRSLERPASASLDAFMLSNDDPRVIRGRAKLTAESCVSGDGRGDRAGRTDWTKCETLHQYARSREELGERRPLTHWSDSSSTAMPSFAWNEWVNAQVHRIHDLLDINTLRLAKEYIDPTYKTMVWNLSQNVDRDTMGKLGLCQCITPDGVPYVASRGGPLVGEELLLLQGIPTDDLLFTKESEGNLKDLAGNAMSTTVVGASVLCALLAGTDALPRSASRVEGGEVAKSLVPRPLNPPSSVSLARMGLYETFTVHLGPGQIDSTDWAEFFSAASSSARKCVREGPEEAFAVDELVACKSCGQTCSRQCAFPPRKYEEHDFVALDAHENRVSPAAFRESLLAVLPMQVEIRGLSIEDLPSTGGVEAALWDEWAMVVSKLCGSVAPPIFRFARLDRTVYWSARFEAQSGGRLECRISGSGATWLLFAETPLEGGLLRSILERPIARMKCPRPSKGNCRNFNLIDGHWEVCLPANPPVSLSIEPVGPDVPSWRSRLGLKGPFESEKQHGALRMTIGPLPPSVDEGLKHIVEGLYTLLPACGGACGSLMKKTDGLYAEKGVYFFLESGRNSMPDDDVYVFSSTCHRTSYGEYREILMQIDTKECFRPLVVASEPKANGKRNVGACIPGIWQAAANVRMSVYAPTSSASKVLVTRPKLAPDVPIKAGSWALCPVVVSCTVPLSHDDELYKKCRATDGGTLEVNLQKATKALERLAFVTSRISIPTALTVGDNWLAFDRQGLSLLDGEDGGCEVCAPRKPKVRFQLVKKRNKISYVPFEDGQEGASYERALKARPEPWVVRLSLPEAPSSSDLPACLNLAIACNAVSLVQRSRGRLPARSLARAAFVANSNFPSGEIFRGYSYGWRIVPHYEIANGSFPELTFTSNKLDSPADQPPSFRKFGLRPEQLRSLAWMIKQESTLEPYYEQEVTEAVLPGLNWRAEGKAERPVLVRGGIIADEVGYGKTAITLGLIDASPVAREGPPAVPTEFKARVIPTNATLVIVPAHLMGQWPDEIDKFLGGSKKTVTIKDMNSMNRVTIQDIMDADLVVASFSVLVNEEYYIRLARLSGIDSGSLPSGTTGGRHFDSVYEEACISLGERVQQIVNSTKDAHRAIVETDKQSKSRASTDVVTMDGKRAAYQPHVNNNEKKGKNAGESKASRGDPWGLATKAVQSNYVKMMCPPLECFHWTRLVVDEFTYLTSDKKNARVHTFALNVKSSFRWFMSGTPRHEGFDDIKELATLLGAHLGIDEKVPKRGKKGSGLVDATGLENLSMYLEVRSLQWHERRHKVAQAFLDRFVRQNVAEIDEIPFEEREMSLQLPPAERAIYLELETYLKSLEMNNKQAFKGKKKATGDRESRMQSVLRDSDSGEEALLKYCCHFDFDDDESSDAKGALQTVDGLIKLRESQQQALKEEMAQALAAAHRQRARIVADQPDWSGCRRTEKGEVHDALFHYLDDVQQRRSVTHGADEDVHELILAVATLAEKKFNLDHDAGDRWFHHDEGDQGEESSSSDSDSQPTSRKRKRKGKTARRQPKRRSEEELYQMKLALRNHMHTVRSMGKELCGRVRSLRYIQWIRRFQQLNDDFECNQCKASGLSADKVGVLSSCGHVGCLLCLRKHAEEGKCIESPSCSARVSLPHVVSSKDLGLDRDDDNTGGKYGRKLTTIVDKVKEITATGDRVLVFCQFDDLMGKVCEALEDGTIPTQRLKGTILKKIATLSAFQKAKPGKNDPRVLVLKMDDEESAGLNLTNLNHAVFVHPLLADSQSAYDAYETQAIGRIRRYGQKKTVNVWRFIAEDTIDTEIYANRRKV